MPRHRVLIVEDEQDIAGLIKHTLERARRHRGANRRQRRRGAQSGVGSPPDLIILDLNLPVVERRGSVPDPAIARRRPARADHHADGAYERRRPRGRPRARRRRLRHQAVQPARAHGPRPGGAAAQRRSRTTSPLVNYRGDAPGGRLRRGVGRGGRRDHPPDPARVRTAPVSGAEQEPRRVARSPARTRLGLRPARSKRDRSTSTSAGCAASSPPRRGKSRR